MEVRHADYLGALDAAGRARRVHDTQFLEFDAILTPPAAGEAPHGLEATGDPLYCRPWTLLQAPCISIPFGTGPAGLPLAVQLVGRRGGDVDLLNAARWAEHALGPQSGAPA